MSSALRTFMAHGVRYELETFGHGHLNRMTRGNVVFERALLEHIHDLKLNGVVVDVGAHVGNHSLWFRLVCGFRVEAFEPLWASELTRNVRRNSADGITIHPVALGAEAGVARQAGPINIEYGAGDITVRTLDSYGFHDVSLIKVDVEGLEDQVLQGAVETIRREQPIIVAEQWDDDANARIRAVLEPLGYTMTKLWTSPDLQTPMGQWAPASNAIVNAMSDPIILQARSKKQLRLAFRELQRTHGGGTIVAFADGRATHVQQCLRGLLETKSITEPVYSREGFAVVKIVQNPDGGDADPDAGADSSGPETESSQVTSTGQPTASDPAPGDVRRENVAGETTVDTSHPAPPPTSGPGSGVDAWRAYAAMVTHSPYESWGLLSRAEIIELLRSEGVTD